jgi:hypothetical protein
MTELEKLAIDYIVAREQFNNLQGTDTPTDTPLEVSHLYEMDMFKHLVNLANHVKFERPEFKQAMGIKD